MTDDFQERVYWLLEELQKMAVELPSEIQQRIPNEVLSGLASSIASGMIYEIIQGLTDVQQGTEKHLFHQRLELLKKHSDEKLSFKARYKETVCGSSDQDELVEATQALNNEQEEMTLRHNEEVKEFDIGVVLKLDQKVSDQQQTLESAGVPGFYVTNNPTDIKVQMHLLDFIQRLEEKERSATTSL